MKTCDEYCEVTCRWCVHFAVDEKDSFNNEGNCMLHNQKTNKHIWCNDFECKLIK